MWNHIKNLQHGNVDAHVKAYRNARDKMLKSIVTINQIDLMTLQDTLNSIITNSQFENSKITENILNKMPGVINKSKIKLGKLSPFSVQTDELSENWSNYHQQAAKLKQKYGSIKEALEQDSDFKDLKSKALKAQGEINTIQGELFEIFLKTAGNIITNDLNDFTQQNVEDIINRIERSVNNTKQFDGTEGQNTRTLSFDFGGKNITISSQQKTDVVIQSPFVEDEYWNISAKNYSSLRDINLVSGANLVGFVSQWLLPDNRKSLYLHSLMLSNDNAIQIQKQGNMLLAIQSLVGVSAAVESLSSVLAIMVRSDKKHPIRLVSISALLKQLTEDDFDTYFSLKFQPELSSFKNGEQLSEKEYAKNISSLRISAKLRRQNLYLRNLKKLTQ